MISEYAVHSPVGNAQARKDLLAKYQAKPRRPASPSKPSYAALIEGLDQSVARIIDHLETTPDPRNPGHALADNTLVVFTSDNGGLRKYADNGPLRGQKGELYEGGDPGAVDRVERQPAPGRRRHDQPHADLRHRLPPDPGRTAPGPSCRRPAVDGTQPARP